MPKFSPGAYLFFFSIIRHLLTAVAGMLVLHGYVAAPTASAYTEELTGVILQAAVMAWSNRAVAWEQVRKIVGRNMPKGATDATVNAKVAELAAANALPSVFTPANVTVSLVKP